MYKYILILIKKEREKGGGESEWEQGGVRRREDKGGVIGDDLIGSPVFILIFV